MKVYHEDRGPEGRTDNKSAKAILYPAMGAILMFAVAVESGALRGDRETWMRNLLADGGKDRLLGLAANHTIGRSVYDRATRQSARLRVSDDAFLDCHLLAVGDIRAEINTVRQGSYSAPWIPTQEFQADMDAVCGAMISNVIERSKEA